MRLMILLSISSLLFGCAGGPARPDTKILQILIDPSGSPAEAYGYNMKDYDDSGVLKPGAQKIVIPISVLKDIKGWYCTDKPGMTNLKVYLGDVRDYARSHCE